MTQVSLTLCFIFLRSITFCSETVLFSQDNSLKTSKQRVKTSISYCLNNPSVRYAFPFMIEVSRYIFIHNVRLIFEWYTYVWYTYTMIYICISHYVNVNVNIMLLNVNDTLISTKCYMYIYTYIYMREHWGTPRLHVC